MPIIKAQNLKKHYSLKSAFKQDVVVKAMDGINFEVETGKTLGIVGESGCGKSTLAKAMMALEPLTEGNLLFDGRDMNTFSGKDRLSFIQMIFQDPYSSINPRKKAWQIVSEPLAINSTLSRDELHANAVAMMQKVGLRPELAERYPHMFSGGQRQRLGIARALMLHPKVLILDEPISALDVSIQAQVLNLLMDLQDELKLTYIFIGHDLGVINHIADNILVMYLGKVVEYGSYQQVFENPQHPYTKALLQSSPSLKSSRSDQPALQGELPSPINPPSGCSFHKRCPMAKAQCIERTPQLRNVAGRLVACDLI
jgi:dipeptide transport system ATP-binding protein